MPPFSNNSSHKSYLRKQLADDHRLRKEYQAAYNEIRSQPRKRPDEKCKLHPLDQSQKQISPNRQTTNEARSTVKPSPDSTLDSISKGHASHEEVKVNPPKEAKGKGVCITRRITAKAWWKILKD